MKFKLLLAISSFFSLTACSPFGNQSIVESISTAVKNLTKTTATVIVSGASSNTATTPQIPADGIYKVTHSVGETFQQTASATIAVDSNTLVPTGYKVYSVIQGAQIQ